MNFQAVSTAQKLPTSDGLTGGYLADGKTPGPLLSKALDFVDASLAKFTAELKKTGHDRDTTIILSAKHGQSPDRPGRAEAHRRRPDHRRPERRVDGRPPGRRRPGRLLDGRRHHAAVAERPHAGGRRLRQAVPGDAHRLRAPPYTKAPVTVGSSGLTDIYAGAAVAKYFGTSASDSRIPDILGIAQTGVVYTGGTSKIAEHGGASADDRNVPIVVSTPDARHAKRIGAPVETTQIAPTILTQLGLDPRALQAVRIENTKPLPSER